MIRNDCSSFCAPVVGNRSFGRILTMFALFFVTIGILLMLVGKRPWIGILPGDLFMKRGNVQIYLPIGSALVLSLILSLAMRFFRS